MQLHLAYFASLRLNGDKARANIVNYTEMIN